MVYLNVDEIESALENLAAAYPSLTELITLPNTSHEHRGSRCLRIGSDASREAVLVLGGVHAREWVPPDALVSFAADLLEAYTAGTGLGYGGRYFPASDVQQSLEQANLFLYACVNPDGRRFSQTAESQWRKNRRPHPSGGGCVGVDINRNFDFLWNHTSKFAPDSGVRTSANPCDPNVYRGPAAASEPETQNVVWLLDSRPTIRWHIDVHSAVPVILHNWGDDQNQTAVPAQTFLNAAFDGVRGRPNDVAYGEFIGQVQLDRVIELGTIMAGAVKDVRGETYPVEPAYGLYPTSGASDDYAYSRRFADPSKPEVLGFTIECGRSFQPTWAEAENVIREVSAALLAFTVEIAEASPASRSVVGKDIASVRQTPG